MEHLQPISHYIYVFFICCWYFRFFGWYCEFYGAAYGNDVILEFTPQLFSVSSFHMFAISCFCQTINFTCRIKDGNVLFSSAARLFNYKLSCHDTCFTDCLMHVLIHKKQNKTKKQVLRTDLLKLLSFFYLYLDVKGNIKVLFFLVFSFFLLARLYFTFWVR